MPEINRAKQFVAFKALKGYEEMIMERAVIPEPKRALSEDRMEMLSKKLFDMKRGGMVTVEYYYGGGYTRKEGLVAGVDAIYRNLIIVRTKIPFDDIWDISCDDNYETY